MVLLFESCMECEYGMYCYENGFSKCIKIEIATEGAGVPYKQHESEDYSYIKKMPFGVYMGLKHIVGGLLNE